MRHSLARTCTAALTLLAVSAALCPTAQAQNTQDELTRLEQDAATAYQAGQYQRAIDLMLDAYDRDPHPNYQLNIAVSYSKLGNCAEARRWAQRALKAEGPALPTEARPIAQGVLDNCQELAQPDPGPGPDPVGPKEPDPTNAILGWTLTGLGGATLLASLLWDLSILSDIDAFIKDGSDRFANDPQGFEEEKERLQGLRPLPIVGYGVGAVLAGTGLIFLILDAEAEVAPAQPGAWRVLPLVSPQATGAAFELRY